MKKITITIAAFAMLTGMLSCNKDFLDDVTDKSVLLREDYVVDLNTTGHYLGGVYYNFTESVFAPFDMVYPDVIADDIKPVTGADGVTPMLEKYAWKQLADERQDQNARISTNCNNFSTSCYQVIRSCNFVIEKAREYTSLNPAKASDLAAQALAVRAWTHFRLVNVFAQAYNFTANGDHPGIAYITSSNWTDNPPGRNTVAEVYASMIADLKEAIAGMDPGAISVTRININAAKALLAKVYLFKGDFRSASALAAEVSIQKPIMTANYPQALFTPNETEALFQIKPAEWETDGYSTIFISYYLRTSVSFVATADIAALLSDPADKRSSWITKNADDKLVITKYPMDVDPNITIPSLSYYQTLLRSSDIYLIAAESYAQIGMTDSAHYFLDAIRQRANPAATPSTSTGAALLEQIYLERRKELAFESGRMFDLQRWKKGVHRSDPLNTQAGDLPYPSNKAIAPIHGLDVLALGFAQNTDY